jgi:hypothetical protein
MEGLRLLQALKNYPTLKSLFGKEWFLKEFSKKEENGHLLIELLLKDPEAEYVKELFKAVEVFL